MRQAVLVARKPVASPAVVVPPAASTRTTLVSAGVVALLAIAFWACDGVLLVRLRAIANVAFTNGPSNPVLCVDDVNDLNAYPPRRLATCLWFPSVQMRTVVCLAIGRRTTWNDAESWVGVLPALLRALRESNDRDFQITVSQSLLCMSVIPPEDVERVFEFTAEQSTAKNPWATLCAHLLNVTAESRPEQRTRAIQAFEQLLSIPEARYEATRRLARLAPESSEAAAAARVYTKTYAPTRGFAGSPEVREIVQRQPALIDELLGGTTNQRLAVFAMASGELMKSTGLLNKNSNDSLRPSWLNWDRLRRMRRDALELAKRTNDADMNESPESVYDFLRCWWDGPEVLFELAEKSRGKRRAIALRYAVAGANRRHQSGDQEFLAKITPDLAIWLGENDAGSQRAILSILFPHYKADWLKRQPNEVKVALLASCRRMLDQSPGDNDFLYLGLMSAAANEIDVADADRIAAALERALHVLKKGYERTNFKPQGTLHDVHKHLFDRLAHLKTRSSVERAFKLRRNLEAEGIIGQHVGPRIGAVQTSY